MRREVHELLAVDAEDGAGAAAVGRGRASETRHASRRVEVSSHFTIGLRVADRVGLRSSHSHTVCTTSSRRVRSRPARARCATAAG